MNAGCLQFGLVIFAADAQCALMWKSSFVIFIVVTIALANMLLVNDYAMPVCGAETTLMADGQGRSSPASISQWLVWKTGALAPDGNMLFWMRLPGVILVTLLLLVWFVVGKKLLGRGLAGMATLAMSSMIATPMLAKTASGDGLLMVITALQMLFLMAALKQKRPVWKAGYWICAIVLLQTAFLPAILWALASGFILQFASPFRSQLKGLFYWLGWTSLAIGGFSIGLHTLPQDELLWISFSSTHLAGWVVFFFIGLVPWLGYLPAALAEMIAQVKKKEEMAIFTAVWLAGALASGTAALLPVIAFMAARQALRYFHVGYPRAAWVRTGFIIQQLILFLVAFFFLLQSTSAFGASGFRQAMFVALMLWAPGLGVLIGLFTRKLGLTWGSLLAGGLLPVLFGLILYVPLIESRRMLPNTLISVLKSTGISNLILIDTDAHRKNQLEIMIERTGITISQQTESPDSIPPQSALLRAFQASQPTPNHSQADTIDWWTSSGMKRFELLSNQPY